MPGGSLTIPGSAKQTGEATVSQIIGHVVIVCGCSAHIVLLLSLGPAKVKCPVCGVERGIKRFRYDVVDGPSGPTAEIDIQLDEPLVRSPISGFQS